MGDSEQGAAPAPDGVRIARRDHELRARFEHVRALNAAWAVLAPFEISAEARHIADTGRAVSEELRRIADQPIEYRDRAALPKLDKLLGAVERELVALAFQVPVAQLRATLPARLAEERRGVLDLLDLMLVAELEEHDGAAGRLGALDYLITLLCTGGSDGDVVEDPVGLTPRLHELCERAAPDDPALVEIEAEFYAAAAVGDADPPDEERLRSLRRRKRELGARFFAPRVLRAIVAYNAALSRRIRHGGWDSRDWGSLADAAEPSAEAASVFETQALPRLAEALRRRARAEAPSPSAIDRVAWCLDLASLSEPERAALLAPSAGTAEDLEGTTMLVGLLCRSAVVLEEELPAIGISPERLTSEWVRELDGALKQKVNAGITGDGYEEARRLSELRSTFLYALMKGEHREQRRTGQRAATAHDPLAREARQIAGEALVGEAPRARPAAGVRPSGVRNVPAGRIARGGAMAAALGIAALALLQVYGGGDFDRLSRSELEGVSPYLESGKRNGEGRGRAFVGTLDDAWSGLAAAQQEQAAAELVGVLREQGVREIMLYDDQHRLRIQALGEQPLRLVLDRAAP